MRGLELVRRCDALIVDDLVAPELVAEAPVRARVVRRRGLRQEQINRILVDLGARGPRRRPAQGRRPVRVRARRRGGAALAAAGVDVEIVPGVSAAAAVPAAFDIPLTHRGVSAQVTLVSGHSASGDDPDWAQLARTPGTLVFFMGLRHAARIAAELIAHGRDASTAAAVIARGTRPDGRCATGELRHLAALTGGLPAARADRRRRRCRPRAGTPTARGRARRLMAHVRIPPVLRAEAGRNRAVDVDGATVREAIDALVDAYPSLRPRILTDDGIPPFLNVFVDGHDIRLADGLDTPVGEDATVLLLPAVAGGV